MIKTMEKMLMACLVFVTMITIFTSRAHALSKPDLSDSGRYDSARFMIVWQNCKAKSYKVYSSTKKTSGFKLCKKLKANVRKLIVERKAKDRYYKVVAVNGGPKKASVIKCPKKIKRTVDHKAYILAAIKARKTGVSLDGYNIQVLPLNRYYPEYPHDTIYKQRPIAAIQEYIATNYPFYSANDIGFDAYSYFDSEKAYSYVEFKGMKTLPDRIKKTKAVLDKVKVSGTAYEKVKKLNDWLIDHATYDEKYAYNSEPYGVVAGHKAICVGYSQTFQYLCSVNGIQCQCVIGKDIYTYVPHMWNAVKIGIKWYVVDVTNNDSYYEYLYEKYHETDPDYPERNRYRYLLVSDATHGTKSEAVFCPEDYVAE